MSRNDFAGLLSQHIKGEYRKNSYDMLKILDQLGDENLAIQRSQRLQRVFDGSNQASENPVTYVNALNSSLRENINDKD